MYPMLQNGDLLEIEKAATVRKGDIVVFAGEKKDQWVAHRVVAIRDGMVYTKGDNNPEQDDRCLISKEIPGMVIARWRNGKRMRIYGGHIGFLQYYLYRIYTIVRQKIAIVFRKLSAPKIVLRCMQKVLPAPREAIFVKNGTEKRVLYLGSLHIGTYSPNREEWQMRFPWYYFFPSYTQYFNILEPDKKPNQKKKNHYKTQIQK
jgi:signal peptidase I